MALEQRTEQQSRLLALACLAGQLQEAMWSQLVDGLAVPGLELLVGEIRYCTEDFIHFTNCQLAVVRYTIIPQLTVVGLSKGLKSNTFHSLG